jgi:ComF family protein
MIGRIDIVGRVAAAAIRLPAAFLFPPVCAGCKRRVSMTGALCVVCWTQVRHIEPPWCPVLGTPFEHDLGEGVVSLEALANPPDFARARAAVIYDGLAAKLVQGLKYADRTDLAPSMARWMIRAGFELLPDAQLVVPIPLHRTRMFRRRYNQSAELARPLAALCGLGFAPEVLVRHRATLQQVGLARAHRQANVRAAFSVPTSARARLAGRRVLLVDDVFTTGATVNAAARALRKGGAAEIDVLTFARVIPGDFRPIEHALI